MDEGPRAAKPLFTFGVIADIQYADIDDGYNFTRTRRRYYRGGLQLLRRALEAWASPASKPDFVLQLGDIIDGYNKARGASEPALEAVLAELAPCPAEVHHVWGNHEFYNFSRVELLGSALNTSAHTERNVSGARAGEHIYAYHFSPWPGYTFVVLDAYDVSLLGRDEASDEHRRAAELLQEHNPNEDLNDPPATEGLMQRFAKFNGGFSQEQLDWLDSVLTLADKKQDRVTIVSHLPVHPCSTDPVCLAWNHDELLDVISAHSCVVCFMAGHDHEGGYCRDEDTGVHHLTMEGVVETPPGGDAFGTVSVYADRMVLEGRGRVANRVLVYPDAQSCHR